MGRAHEVRKVAMAKTAAKKTKLYSRYGKEIYLAAKDMYFYNTDDKRIEKIINDFNVKDYFNQIGVLTRQVGTLLYPRSNQSLTIKNALINNFDQVALIEECQALKIIKRKN